MVTDAAAIELDAVLTRVEVDGRSPRPSAIDLVVDDEFRCTATSIRGPVLCFDSSSGKTSVREGLPSTIRFDGVARGRPVFAEIWLPHDGLVELRELRIPDGAAARPPMGARRRWTHHGSSISHCLDAARPTERWSVAVARRAGVDLLDLGFAGHCMLDPMVARTVRDAPADSISLKVGINLVNGDTMRAHTFTPALHGFLDTIRDGHSTTPIALVTPIACPVVEDRSGPTTLGPDAQYRSVDRPPELAIGSLSVGLIRELVAELVADRRVAGDCDLHLVDGLDLLGPEEAVLLRDGLHPTEAGYQRIGERFYRLLFGDAGPFASMDG